MDYDGGSCSACAVQDTLDADGQANDRTEEQDDAGLRTQRSRLCAALSLALVGALAGSAL